MLLSSSTDAVLAAAGSLADELQTVQETSTANEFESLLIECNKLISDELDIEYGEICETDSGCC